MPHTAANLQVSHPSLAGRHADTADAVTAERLPMTGSQARKVTAIGGGVCSGNHAVTHTYAPPHAGGQQEMVGGCQCASSTPDSPNV